MTNYSFFPELFVRTPLFSYSAYKQKYPLILDSEDFKTALFFASRAFYNEVSKKNFIYEELTEKQRQGIDKYINRAVFRSTPFGLFSSITMLNWSDKSEYIVLSDPGIDLRLDFAILHQLWEQVQNKVSDKSTKFSTNSSVYINNIDIRFIKRIVAGGKTKFSVVSVEKSQVLIALLKFCRRKKRTFAEMLSFLSKDHDANEAASFLSDLIEEQLIISEASPNLTGKDYWEVLSPQVKKNLLFRDVCDQVETATHNPNAGKVSHLSSYLDQKLMRPETTNYFYCISERKRLQGSLTSRYQNSLREGLYCLDKLSPYLVNKDLQAFKQSFTKKYENKEIPLLEAMDAQFGVGYGGLEKIKVGYGFSSGGYNSSRVGPLSAQKENELAAWFLNQWKEPRRSSFELEISDEHLNSLHGDASAKHLPPTISVMFRILGEMVCIESAGGASALGLIGRFSFLDEIGGHAKHIAQLEQSRNKNVVFAEIAHVCDLHTANINRRQHFYDYEIPVLTNSTLPEERQLQLDDLMVSVRNDQVVLRSARLNQIVIPRLSSAFNYTRNDLPVFRFLCDLQSQGLKTGFSFSLSSLIPGLRFYPRLRYRSCILQLAEWHFKPGELPVGTTADSVMEFQKLARDIDLPPHFSYTIGDHFLVFDLESKGDIELFLREVKGKDHVVVKEFPFLSQEGQVKTSRDEPLLAQYMATLYRDEEVYNEALSLKNQVSGLQNDKNDWIYFKLYCHPLSSDILLRNYIFPLIEKLKKDGLLERWFWLRYLDPDYHLRIRIKADEKSKRKVLKALMLWLDKACLNKLAHYFRADVYQQELERYSPELIEKVEEVFQASSELICKQLMDQNEQNYEDPGVIVEAASASYSLLEAFGFDLNAKAQFCKNAFEGFFKEFNSSKELKTEMEKLYRSLERDILYSLNLAAGSPQYRNLKNAVRGLLSEQGEKKVHFVSTERLAGDLIHMHQNRLFVYDQRYFEMIQYYLLYRILYRQLHTAAG